MSRSFTPLLAAALAFTVTPLIAVPADAAPTATARSYRNCTELNRDYPAGVGRRGAKDRTSGTPVRNFRVDNALYNSVARKMDRDKDGIACEKLTSGNSTTKRPTTKRPTTKRPTTKRPAPAKKTATKTSKSTGPTIVTSGSVAFTTPSGNITCKTLDGFQFCSIEQRTYRSTQRPSDCHEAWGNVFYLYARGGFLCADRTLDGQAPAASAWFAQTNLKPLKSLYGPQAVLPYGWTLRNSDYTCTSETTGVTCTDLSTGHGWMISKAKYQVF